MTRFSPPVVRTGLCPSRSREVAVAVAQRWANLMLRMSMRKRWAVRGHLMAYAKKMPMSVDGKGSGFGSHLREPGCVEGRWGWREIPHQAF